MCDLIYVIMCISIYIDPRHANNGSIVTSLVVSYMFVLAGLYCAVEQELDVGCPRGPRTKPKIGLFQSAIGSSLKRRSTGNYGGWKKSCTS